jgi:hypothetical protein
MAFSRLMKQAGRKIARLLRAQGGTNSTGHFGLATQIVPGKHDFLIAPGHSAVNESDGPQSPLLFRNAAAHGRFSSPVAKSRHVRGSALRRPFSKTCVAACCNSERINLLNQKLR